MKYQVLTPKRHKLLGHLELDATFLAGRYLAFNAERFRKTMYLEIGYYRRRGSKEVTLFLVADQPARKELMRMPRDFFIPAKKKNIYIK